ncbi:MAG: nucleotide sugar dehydrogenase [Candidatus Heimdallarchaeota archaeon]|nr:nucleotide sugar dehydrogenase [Candidatus Heimdallarchaeota archaeon]
MEIPYKKSETEIINSRPKITIIGLGKMGIPLCLVFTNAGYGVRGYDISQNLVEALNKGETTLKNEPLVNERLRAAILKKKFKAFTDLKKAVYGSSFIIIIIPIITDINGQTDLSSLNEIYLKLEQYIDPGAIIIQESTLPPGITSGPLRDILQANGKKSGVDFGLVFAPERTFSGRVIEDIEARYPKLVGGDTKNASVLVQKLYEQVCEKGVVVLSNATTAEAVKTFKGAYRDANIAIANQLAILSDLYKVDILEIIEAANTEPFSHIHKPGIGVGGHCIPIYPKFLINQALEKSSDAAVFQTARDMNDFMVKYCIEVLKKTVNKLSGAKILILGLAYRGGVKEARYSPTLRLIPQLRSEGAIIKLHDPMFNETEVDQLFGAATNENSISGNINLYDIVIIVTDHEEFYNTEEFYADKIVFDGRYVLKPEKSKKFKLLQPGRLFVID